MLISDYLFNESKDIWQSYLKHPFLVKMGENTLDKETQNTTSSLLKKAGMEGSATASNNTLSKKIATYETKIVRLEKLFSKKQQNLYSKYASLETLMNNLNSQMNYLTSMFSS